MAQGMQQPPMQPQVPPMQQMGQMPPQQQPQMPPQMQQMQYTLNSVVESIKKLDSDIRTIKETQSQMPQKGSIEIGSRIVPAHGETSTIRETVNGTNILDKRLSGLNEDHIVSKQSLIAKDANELSRLNDFFESQPKTPGVE
jgi:hypothetical protein